MVRKTILLIVFAIFAWSDMAVAESVTGVVVDRSKNPVPNARVSIAHTEFGRQPTILTDQQGRFSQQILRPGEYYVEVYWGIELVFRKKYKIEGNKNIGELKL